MLKHLAETLHAYWPGRKQPLARVAINLAPRRAPYGGGNQFVLQLSRYLRFHGYDVVHRLDSRVNCILIMDGRETLTTFGVSEINAFRQRHPSVTCLHRVNECDQRKGTDFMDDLLARTNTVADHTVFVSRWVRDYHAARWFDRGRPHTVIPPGPDSRDFHPFGQRPPASGAPFRIATHHWSDNPMKGFPVYARIDDAIAAGRLKNVELWVIGRWPKGYRWRAARLLPPQKASAVAHLLRQCHAYVTASLWEPGGMHVVEGAACGLPVLYHRDSGGTVELAKEYGVEFSDDVEDAVCTLQNRYMELRRRLLEHLPSGEDMCMRYHRTIQRCLVEKEAVG